MFWVMVSGEDTPLNLAPYCFSSTVNGTPLVEFIGNADAGLPASVASVAIEQLTQL
jgi:hypothetical protein